MEGDIESLYGEWMLETISIHALRVEGDRVKESKGEESRVFLSTPSGWRATRESIRLHGPRQRISIHALRVEGDLLLYLCSQNAEIISIHALRVEGDLGVGGKMS